MQINSLKLLNYRNYESLEINFSNRTNIIYGKNGMGKTNLIEAIYILGLTKTFRLGNEDVVIKKGKNIAKIEGSIKDKIINNYKIIISDNGKRIKIDNNKITKMSDYITRINIILFNPDDLKIIKDTPSTRRKLLNIEISSINNDYVKVLTDYNKVLKQRNSYLKALSKKNIYQTDFLNILTEQLVDLGLKIMLIRSEFIENINSYISDIYFKITGKGPLSINYKSEYKGKTKEQLLSMYEKNISREIIMGKTLFGPHHDDIEFITNKEIVKEYSSIGEQKNSVIAFKLAEIKNIEDKLNKKPILILDDLFSELDQEKINNILTLIDDDMQTFITTTEIDKVDQKLIDKAKIFKCINGTIKEEVSNGK
ncbi:MAG: DNA replication/repair protein RecF [Firmicutes bacterium]|nr:DNA replication/repair protein RecF [Bacillota bacterium]